jgi:hypothetical protein
MKTMILTAILTLTTQVAPPKAAPIKPDMIVTVTDAPVTAYVYADLALVAYGTRIIGPLPWLGLPGVPGQEDATVGITGMCVTYLAPQMPGGTVTYPAGLSATAPTLGQAIAGLKDQIGAIEGAGGMLHPCP